MNITNNKNKNKTDNFKLNKYYLELINTGILIPFDLNNSYTIEFKDKVKYFFSFKNKNHFYDFDSPYYDYYDNNEKFIIVQCLNLFFYYHKENKTLTVKITDKNRLIVKVLKNFEKYEYPELIFFIERLYKLKYCIIKKDNKMIKKFISYYFYKVVLNKKQMKNLNSYYRKNVINELPFINLDEL